jgi:hypothetical protein
MRYRPWGTTDWVLSLSSPKEWNFVGAIATEERSLCSWGGASETRGARKRGLRRDS